MPRGPWLVSALVVTPALATTPSSTPPAPTTVPPPVHGLADPVRSDALLRRVVADVAVAQVGRPDAAWEPAQRDCAGLVRYAYRTAWKRLRPERLARGPLFLDGHGQPSDFADVESLVRGKSFVRLGRDVVARRRLQTGDVLVYRQDRGDDDVAWHMMLAIVPPGADARVVYHPGHAAPGEPEPGVRHGSLRELEREAPLLWRADVDNPSFLGFFRFAELAE